MKFTPEQVEEIRDSIGSTTEGAEQIMQEIATMLADHIRGLIDAEALRDGDSYCRGIAAAADAIDAA